MSHFHFPPVALRAEKKTLTYFLRQQPENLIVFVHGFGGSAEANSTWKGFPSQLTQFKTSDIIFYGYDSLGVQATNSAVRFLNFLDATTSFQIKPPVPRKIDAGHQYKRIILVAHSLGAIIVRRALLDANSVNKKWVDQCRMILFAPAHKGARVINLVFEALPSLGKALAGVANLKFRTLVDLKADSQVINDLINDTNRLSMKKGKFTVAREVVWAEHEDIVHNARFCNDPVATEEKKHTHRSVCKPTPSYGTPIEYLNRTLIP